MKRAQLLATVALVGLLIIAVILLVASLIYGGVANWAGFMLAAGQAALAGLALWGLTLSRQQAELRDFDAPASAAPEARSFRLSSGDESDAASTASKTNEVRTLETGLQRVLTALAGIAMLALAGTCVLLIYNNYADAAAAPDKPFPIGRAPFDALAILISIVAAVGYVILWANTRPRASDETYTEAVNSHATLGAPGMLAVGAAGVLAFFGVTHAQEFAAGVVAALLALQGLELIINALRSYSSIEEFDQEPVDLQALPLVPMLGSVWLSSLKQLFAQSLGLAGEGEKGVIGRMMPRALLASVVLAIVLSCFRVVPVGEVAVLERLGHAVSDEQGNMLIHHPGLHITLPWPIDSFVNIPHERLNFVSVGAELENPADFKGLDFTFWTFRHTKEHSEEDAEFVTAPTPNVGANGEAGTPQLLETYVGVWWRVKDPHKFYNALSHSEFYEHAGEETKTLPIYEAIIQQAAKAAVTRTYARSTLDDIMTIRRSVVERRCHAYLQKFLDSLGDSGSGIEIVNLTIKDVHPPYGEGQVPDPREPDGVRRGPAHAYENVVTMRQGKELAINQARAQALREIAMANSDAQRDLSEAEAFKASQIADAQGQAARLQTMVRGWADMPASERQFLSELARRNYVQDQTRDLLPNTTKVILGPGVTPPDIWQINGDRVTPVRPPAP